MDADSAERSRKRGRPSAPIATAAQQTSLLFGVKECGVLVKIKLPT